MAESGAGKYGRIQQSPARSSAWRYGSADRNCSGDTVFKKRFTKSEQQTVATNFIMGLSFITEGAIPFAASDPLLFLAAVAAGSVVAMLGIVLLKNRLQQSEKMCKKIRTKIAKSDK